MRHTDEAIASVIAQLAANQPLDRLHRTVDAAIAERGGCPDEVYQWLAELESGVE